MAKFSANLGFLWTELPLPEAIRAAKKAGFAAVECHWPYQYPTEEIKAALKETGLPMLGLNVRRGNVALGEMGLAAVPGRQTEARTTIDEACAYASAIDCQKIHVMAGITNQGLEAETTFQENLNYACDLAAKMSQTILIEPLNTRDAPGYHLTDVNAAIQTITSVGCNNLKLMFDCYHIQIMHGDIIHRLRKTFPYIGHVQIAGVPARGEPDVGELNYKEILKELDNLRYEGFVGAEYKPKISTDIGLSWLKDF
jgi:2-dehydrotetronate isomerase